MSDNIFVHRSSIHSSNCGEGGVNDLMSVNPATAASSTEPVESTFIPPIAEGGVDDAGGKREKEREKEREKKKKEEKRKGKKMRVL
jgi:hypothetical protein